MTTRTSTSGPGASAGAISTRPSSLHAGPGNVWVARTFTGATLLRSPYDNGGRAVCGLEREDAPGCPAPHPARALARDARGRARRRGGRRPHGRRPEPRRGRGHARRPRAPPASLRPAHASRARRGLDVKVAVLSGGVGGARFVQGVVATGEDVSVIGNVGDDVEVLGLHVSPDLDSL